MYLPIHSNLKHKARNQKLEVKNLKIRSRNTRVITIKVMKKQKNLPKLKNKTTKNWKRQTTIRRK